LNPQAGLQQSPPLAGPPQLNPQAGLQQSPLQAGLPQLTLQDILPQHAPLAGPPQFTLQAGKQLTPQVGTFQSTPQAGPQQFTPQVGQLLTPQAGQQLYPQDIWPHHAPLASPPQLTQQDISPRPRLAPQDGPPQLISQDMSLRLSPQAGSIQDVNLQPDQQMPHNISSSQPDIANMVYQQGELTKLLLEHNLKSSLPQRVIQTFDGDPLEYPAFMSAFKYCIEEKSTSDKDRLYYLEQYTRGDANKLVRSCMSAEDGYFQAKKLLEKKYGNKHKIAEAFVKKAMSWPEVKSDDTSQLGRLSLFLIECRNVLTDLNCINELDHTTSIKAIVLKLPYRLRDRWRVTVDRIMEECGHTVKFSHLVDFIEKQSRIASNPVYGDVASARDGNKATNRNSKEFNRRPRGSSFATNVASPGQGKQKSAETPSGSTDSTCTFCNGKNHSLAVCRKLQSKPNKDKIDFLKSKKLCFGCLKQGSHMSKDCTKRLTCQKCNRPHPTVLHRDEQRFKESKAKEEEGKGQTDIRSAGSQCTPLNGAGTPVMVPVKVHSRQTGRTVITYAFLDDGSNAVFCSEKLKAELGATGRKTKLQVQTILEDQQVDSRVLKDLEISDMEGENTIQLPDVYTQDKMPVSLEDAVTTSDITQWPYLHHVKLPDFRKEAKEVGLLIGSNVPKASEPWEVVHSENDGPYAYRTLLGWVVCGLKGKSGITSNRILVKSDLHQQLVNMFNHDFSERTVDDQPEKSVEDKQFLAAVSSTIKYNNGHYEIGLPLKNPDVKMPNNKVRAEERAEHLKRKLKKDPQFYEEYKDFMSDMMKSGYAEKVPLVEHSPDSCKWYIPHHGVRHPQKQKLRVVFDCAARYGGTSLNDQLMQGPDLTNTLIGVLTRFRQDSVALMADIKSMFYQVQVPEADRNLMCFLWWPEGDLDQPLEEYRMAVHSFGATSSPSCANYALRKTAEDNKDQYESRVVNTVYNNFYVDDCLCSLPTEEAAASVVKDLQSLLQSGGFRLTKWTSNSRNVIEAVPEMERAEKLKSLDLTQDDLPTEKALGMLWFAEADSFGYKIEPKVQPSTRRGILSTTSSVYDPLGFIGPVVLTAKQLLQDLCKQQYGWDEQIPEPNRSRWQEWLVDLPKLADYRVDRCLKPKNYGAPKRVQIHHFSDASESGYGTVSYMRMENDHGIHCSFLTSKARVVPIKQVTIPRLELTAATVAVRVNTMLLKELQIQVDEVHYWTDSTTVLHYIENETARYHTFVANRVNLIREGSTPNQWHYIKSADNPADDCSRGLSVADFLKCERWHKGPPFLWKQESQWPKSKLENSAELSSVDPEVKVATTVVKAEESPDSIDKLLNYYSNWHDLKKAVGWILRVRKYLLAKAKEKKEESDGGKVQDEKKEECDGGRVQDEKKEECDGGRVQDEKKEEVDGSKVQDEKNMNTSHLAVAELQIAEDMIIQYIQWKSFPEEVKVLSNIPKEEENRSCYVKTSSSIYRLDPEMKNGVLRVGGRLNKAAMPEETKHPAILPKHNVTNLILRHIHELSGHSGRNYMLAQAQRKYWIIKANATARKIINKCVVCRRKRSRMEQQKMADLPKARITPEEAPFTRVGVDYFGPIEVKQGRSMVKRYGVVFTCLAIRAVHIEKADTLETNSCISAIRRFMARRGQVKQLISDNGTNLVGAEKELRKHIDQWNQSKIHESLLQHNIDWVFNPPAASHFGGVWERQIRTIRRLMSSILKEQTMTDESLQTLFCEVESVINNRPITRVPGEPGDLEALTPNHLLLMKVKPALPPTVAEETGPYAKRRWKQVQYMTDLFWKRWSREYVTQLQKRQKWALPQSNIKVGDIVLVANESTPRNQWMMGRVIVTLPDQKGYVRQVKLRTKTSTLLRPVHKLILLLEADDPEQVSHSI
jgi:hypothetical protein